ALHAFSFDGRHNTGGLFAAHHGDAGVGPHPQKVRAVGASAHAVVACAEAAADQYGDLGHVGAGHGHNQLGAVFGDAFGFVRLPDHEAGVVLEEQHRDVALAAQFEEGPALLGGLAEQDAVVGDDADRVAVDVGEAGDQCLAVIAFEFVKFGAVDDAGDHVAHVELFAQVSAHDAVDFVGAVQGRFRFSDLHIHRFAAVEVGDAAPGDVEGVGVVFGVMVGHTGDFAVYVGASQVFGADHFTGGGFHQRRASQEDGALVAHDDGFVGHGGHVGAASGAQAHNDGDL